MNEAGVFVLGGHSIDDPEIKFGYSVTGIVHPSRVVTNANAQVDDSIILTKPIGTGAIITGIKHGVAKIGSVEAAMRAMTTSASAASVAMQQVGANACTDVTGFGLLGHAYEMAKASDVCLNIEAASVPLLPDVLELIAQGMLTRGDKNNRTYVGENIEIGEHISRHMGSALFDPQTAGGLLISIATSKAEELRDKIEGSVIIGNVEPRGEFLLRVT